MCCVQVGKAVSWVANQRHIHCFLCVTTIQWLENYIGRGEEKYVELCFSCMTLKQDYVIKDALYKLVDSNKSYHY